MTAAPKVGYQGRRHDRQVLTLQTPSLTLAHSIISIHIQMTTATQSCPMTIVIAVTPGLAQWGQRP